MRGVLLGQQLDHLLVVGGAEAGNWVPTLERREALDALEAAIRAAATRACNQREVYQSPACIYKPEETLNQSPACIYKNRKKRSIRTGVNVRERRRVLVEQRVHEAERRLRSSCRTSL